MTALSPLSPQNPLGPIPVQLEDQTDGYLFSSLLIDATNGWISHCTGLVTVVERHLARKNFKAEDYWSLSACYAGTEASSDDSDEAHPHPDAGEDGDDKNQGRRVMSQAEAEHIVAIAQSQLHMIAKLTKKRTAQKLPPHGPGRNPSMAQWQSP